MDTKNERQHHEDPGRMENYVMAEFVAVPPDFDITTHLSMHEHVGIFDTDKIDIKEVSIISSAVANSAVFSVMNNPNINPESCLFFLQLMSELNLIIKKIDNPLRRSRESYKDYSKHICGNNFTYMRGQEFRRISIIIINIVPLMSQNIIDEAWLAMNELQAFQNEVNKDNFKLD